jgi:hypothetical protein
VKIETLVICHPLLLQKDSLYIDMQARGGATTAREIAPVIPASQPSQCAFFLAQRFVNFFPTNLYLCHYIMILSRFASYKTPLEHMNSKSWPPFSLQACENVSFSHDVS